MRLFILSVLFAVPLYATNEVVSYHAEVVTSMNPNEHACVESVSHYGDTVNACHAGKAEVVFFVVADSNHCSHNQLARFVGNRAKVVVRRNALRLAGLRQYNETVVNCVETVRVKNRVARRQVRPLARVLGALVGNRRRAVQSAADSCR
jgi:hypothetical protein